MQLIRLSYAMSVVILTLSACSSVAPEPVPSATLDPLAAMATFSERVATLADDRMQGRAPSSVGEARTVEYLTAQFQAAGLQPGPDGTFTQNVPLVAVTATKTEPLIVTGAADEVSFTPGRDVVLWTKRLVTRSAISDSELVYVGYGIVAPEYDWDDYAGLDVRGKTVVVLVNDPGFATRDADLFNGFSMTYYGRWTYKYEEAARQGAAGVLIVHENEAAGYPWQVVAGSWTGDQFDLVAADRNLGRAAIEGWLSLEAAQRVFSAAGMNYETERDRAAQRGFRGTELDLTASTTVENTITESESANVYGVLAGSTYPDEYIVYSAHWDHLGMAPAEERNLAQRDSSDRIFNGAKDNASGVAMMLGIADAFAAAKAPPERSIVFLAVTAEESGLLGSAWYGSNPVFPLEKTVANLNLDAPTLLGPTRDITVIGYGSSELETILARHAKMQDRVLQQEPTPEKGFFYRSDHFNFSKRGVPALYAKAGIEHRERGIDYGTAWEADYIASRYHKVADEFDPNWDLRGIAEDMQLYYAVGNELANTRQWPEWFDGNEFKAIRDQSAAARRP